tara:strand:+ start:116 stop:427 length:312 start_codon:yes stop_codon:yes gene_type:complete
MSHFCAFNLQNILIPALSLHLLTLVIYLLIITPLTMSNSQVTEESGGRQNMFPTETRPYVDASVSYDGYPQNAEKVNGRWAMIGFVALLGAYISTGQIIPGIF